MHHRTASSFTVRSDDDVLALLYRNDPVLTEEFRLARRLLRSLPSSIQAVAESCPSPPQTTQACGDASPSAAAFAMIPGISRQARALSTVFYLSMIQYDTGLMYTTARLFLHLSSTVERKRLARLEELRVLQQRQEGELSAVLTMADAGTAPLLSSHGEPAAQTLSLVVDSLCTESVFRRHAAEIEALESAHADAARQAICEANEQLHSFLKAAAPDYVSHILQQGASSPNKRDEKDVPVLPFLSVCDLLLFPHRPVDVLVLRIVNPLRGQVVGARPKDPTLAPIVLECSHLCRLADCNALALKRYVDEDHQERWARRAQDHLGRIAGGQHSVLLVVGGRAEAEEWLGLVAPSKSAVASGHGALDGSGEDQEHALPPELVLPLSFESPAECGAAWAPLLGSEMLGMSTTRLYAANYVLVFDPTPLPSGVCSTGTGAPVVQRLGKGLRDALHFATSHGANRFSVAVLPSFGRTCAHTPSGRRGASEDLKKMSGDAAVLYELHHAIAAVQLALNCGKPPSRTGLHIAGLLHQLSEYRLMTPTIYAAAGVASFNLAMAVRCFVESHPMELAAAEAFQQDVEVIARIPVIQ
jgi:hypothetical protein